MDVYQWLCALGIPSIVSGIVLLAVRGSVSKLGERLDRKIDETARAQKNGIQAILRNDLNKLYDECSRKGYATHSERDNFQNMYRQYHILGANGVMDDTRNKFMELPIR